jgi:hypothetical protein
MWRCMDNIVAAHLGVSGTLYEIPHRECCLMKIPRECMREVFQVCTGGARLCTGVCAHHCEWTITAVQQPGHVMVMRFLASQSHA